MQFALEQSRRKPRAWKGHRAPWVAAPSLSRKRRAAEGGGNWSCLIPQVAELGQPDAASSQAADHRRCLSGLEEVPTGQWGQLRPPAPGGWSCPSRVPSLQQACVLLAGTPVHFSSSPQSHQPSLEPGSLPRRFEQ